MPGPGALAGGDKIVVWYEGSGTADKRWLLGDERGSVVAVADASGAALAVNRYGEYGIPATGNLGRFQYTGQMWLPELGLYNYKARMYSATLGRFMQTDPIGYGDGLNWYAYVGGDPVNKVDPSGMFEGITVNGIVSGGRFDGIVVSGRRNSPTGIFDSDWPLGPRAFYNSGLTEEQIGNLLSGTTAIDRLRSQGQPKPQSGKAKDDPGCGLALAQDGNIIYEATTGTLIVGGWITVSRGTFINTATGTTGSFYSLGGGGGADIGVAESIGTASSLALLNGGGASFNASAGIATFSANGSLGHHMRIPTIPRRDTDMITRIVPI